MHSRVGVARPCEIRIFVSTFHRFLGLCAGTIVALAYTAFAGLVLTGVLHPTAIGSNATGVRIFSLVTLSCLYIGGRRGRRIIRQALLERPKLIVRAEYIELHWPGLLKNDVVIPIDEVRAVAVDGSPSSQTARFRIAPQAPDRLYAWAWRRSRREDGPLVLSIDPANETPNVLMLLEKAHDLGLRGMRGILSISADVRCGRGEHAVLLRVADPDAAREALERHGIRTDLVAGDEGHLARYLAPATRRAIRRAAVPEQEMPPNLRQIAAAD